jgi:transcriptional regulator with XRE-family HTH domain
MKEGFNCDVLRSNIRYLRKKMNLSQEDLATMIGLNRGNIASYESGTAEPRIANLVKMSKLFSVPLADLTEKKICEKYVSMSAEEWQKESDRLIAELKGQKERLKITQTYYESILNCKKMFKENNPVLSDDALELELYFKQLQTLTDKILKTQKEFIDRLSIPLDCKAPHEENQ